MTTITYKAGDLIPLGDLIRTYILHLLIPTDQRGIYWNTEDRLMRTVLNEWSTEVPQLPGTIEVKI